MPDFREILGLSNQIIFVLLNQYGTVVKILNISKFACVYNKRNKVWNNNTFAYKNLLLSGLIVTEYLT